MTATFHFLFHSFFTVIQSFNAIYSELLTALLNKLQPGSKQANKDKQIRKYTNKQRILWYKFAIAAVNKHNPYFVEMS
jgi:hypothetical protein